MNGEMKYVMIDDCIPIIFSSAMQHSDFKHLNPTSAGMVRIDRVEGECRFTAQCYGKSVSLNMKPAITDSKCIEYMFNDY